jgi:hypothetical protein
MLGAVVAYRRDEHMRMKLPALARLKARTPQYGSGRGFALGCGEHLR